MWGLGRVRTQWTADACVYEIVRLSEFQHTASTAITPHVHTGVYERHVDLWAVGPLRQWSAAPYLFKIIGLSTLRDAISVYGRRLSSRLRE